MLHDLYLLKGETHFDLFRLTSKYFYFVDLYPNGMSVNDLAKEMNIQDMVLAQKVFHMLDKKEDGVVDVKEFLTAISLLLDDQSETTRKFQYDLWDKDNDGYLDFDDIYSMIKVACQLKRLSVDISPEQVSEKIMKELGYKIGERIPEKVFNVDIAYTDRTLIKSQRI